MSGCRILAILFLPMTVSIGALCAPGPSVPKPDYSPTAAVRRAIPILQKSADTWTKRRACISCHQQALTQVTMALAKDHGFSVDTNLTEIQNKRIGERLELSRLDRLEGFGSINGSVAFPYFAFGTAASKIPANPDTDATVVLLLQKQSALGDWPSYSHRPPLEDSNFTATALAIRTLKNYTPKEFAAEAKSSIDRAVKWLAKTQPASNEDRTMQILGLVWAGQPESTLLPLVAKLKASQRPDGGWAQLPSRQSDAYATGQALVALYVSGEKPTSPVYTKGVVCLVKSQQSDGSWRVETRRRYPGLPYFESGFPHKEHQFISFAGTCWATMALTLASRTGSDRALTDTTLQARGLQKLRLAQNEADNRTLRSALFGTLDDLKSSVKSGRNVNALSESGCTPLHYAVRDPQKVAWLLQSGADPNIVSKTGTTPLLLASEYAKSETPLDLLLKAGAKTDIVASGFYTPLSLALSTAKYDRFTRLAELDPKFKYHYGTATMAETVRDPKALALVISTGYPINTKLGDFNEYVLAFAIMDGYTEGVKLLLNAGANPNAHSFDGLPLLMGAAMNDPGHTQIVQLLLDGGADPAFKTADGKTALSLAKKYNNLHIAKLLETRQ